MQYQNKITLKIKDIKHKEVIKITLTSKEIIQIVIINKTRYIILYQLIKEQAPNHNHVTISITCIEIGYVEI